MTLKQSQWSMQRTSEEKVQRGRKTTGLTEDSMVWRSEGKGNVWGFWRDDEEASFKRTRLTQRPQQRIWMRRIWRRSEPWRKGSHHHDHGEGAELLQREGERAKALERRRFIWAAHLGNRAREDFSRHIRFLESMSLSISMPRHSDRIFWVFGFSGLRF